MTTEQVLKHSWEQTDLWDSLTTKHHDTPARRLVEACMPDVETILAQGGTAPTDFTLHDNGHAYRVAQRMVEIVPSHVLSQMSSSELALLLLSAYLHDIGMTPQKGTVTRHFDYVLTGAPDLLHEDELSELVEWLDDEWDAEVPIPPAEDEEDRLRLARELITYYCRHKHNEWSATWIRDHISGCQPDLYPNWLEDLVALCVSHHEGYSALVNERFDPRVIGDGVVHLRYLAVVLRVADILEFDPERTPSVLLKHRDVASGSLVYWYKDHAVASAIEGGRVVVSARPRSARIHKAIEVMVDDIDTELRLAWTLNSETHFDRCPGLQKPLPHDWSLSPSVHRDLRPHDGTYEYIDGAFRPDTQKLLQLLSGVELYGSRLAAVRELLQNSFDAVREQIAWERLALPDPGDPELEKAVRALHRVTLRLKMQQSGATLVCTDTGVGMTKAIIRDHLLVSGAAKRHDIQDLARKCRQAGIEFDRTGQFGIGVLSYFMIAEGIRIRTRRSQEADGVENGWVFETEGVGSFGELRSDRTIRKGTSVELRLKPDMVGNDFRTWYNDLVKYLKDTLVHIPCRFEMSAELDGCAPAVWPAGWVRLQQELTDGVVDHIRWGIKRLRTGRYPEECLSTARRQELEDTRRHLTDIEAQVRSSIMWKEFCGVLPDALGYYRIHVPRFALHGGQCFGFMDICDNQQVNPIGDGHIIVPNGQTSVAWKGMRVALSDDDDVSSPTDPVQLEINLTHPDAGLLGVDRMGFFLSAKAQRAIRNVCALAATHCRELRQAASHTFTPIDRAITVELLSEIKPVWLVASEDDREDGPRWAQFSYPAICEYRFGTPDVPKRLEYVGRSVTLLTGIERTGNSTTLLWTSVQPPSRIVLTPDLHAPVAPLWLGENSCGRKHAVGVACEFPPGWENVCGVVLLEHMEPYILNSAHPLCSLVDQSAWDWFIDEFDVDKSPVEYEDQFLESAGKAAAWLLGVLFYGYGDLWDGLCEQEPEFISRVLDKALVRKEPLAVIAEKDWGRYALRAISRAGWNETSLSTSTILKHLPDPGPEWKVAGRSD